MLRIFVRFARLLDNYRYYRNSGIHVREAWYLAKVTLPE